LATEGAEYAEAHRAKNKNPLSVYFSVFRVFRGLRLFDAWRLLVKAGSSSGAELGMVGHKALTGFSVKEFRQPPLRHLSWHEHRHASICFVVAGSYEERVRGRSTECATHSVILKPPMEQHADLFGKSGGTCLLIEIEPDRLQSIVPYSDIAREPSFASNPRLTGLGRSVYREFIGNDALSPLAIEALILELLVETSRANDAERSHRKPHWLRQVHDLIHDCYHEPLTLASVAHAVMVHPSRLASVFRRHYGSSLGDYLRRLRVEHASLELMKPGVSLAEISNRLGFFDQAHFSRVFKRYTGLTPTQFRAAWRDREARTKAIDAS
jgi:AraC family transcriptional regulator